MIMNPKYVVCNHMSILDSNDIHLINGLWQLSESQITAHVPVKV